MRRRSALVAMVAAPLVALLKLPVLDREKTVRSDEPVLEKDPFQITSEKPLGENRPSESCGDFMNPTPASLIKKDFVIETENPTAWMGLSQGHSIPKGQHWTSDMPDGVIVQHIEGGWKVSTDTTSAPCFTVSSESTYSSPLLFWGGEICV